MESVASGGPGLVAVGWCAADDDYDASVWVSSTGVEWERIGLPHFGGPLEQRMTSVAAGEPGIVAVGLDYNRPMGADAAVWFSPDGLEWERIESSSFEGPDYQEMWSVHWAGDRFVAAGFFDEEGSRDLALWVSEDGRTWTRLDRDLVPNSRGTGLGDSMDRNIAQRGSVIVIVSSFGVWRSPDAGATWSFVTGGPDARSGSNTGGFHTVAAVADGFLAVGLNEQAEFWTSSDGTDWEAKSTVDTRARGLVSLDVVGAADGAAVVGGQQHSTTTPPGPLDTEIGGALLVSEDLVSWTRAAAKDEQPPNYVQIAAVAGFRDGLVAVGATGTDHPLQEAAVWITTPAG